MEMQTNYRVFRGSNAANDSAGFRIGQRYLLRCTRRDDGQLLVKLAYTQPGVEPVVVSEEPFKEWFGPMA